MGQASLYTFPWMLREEGSRAALARMRGCGIERLLLAITYHPAAFLTPRRSGGILRTQPISRVYFRPDDRLYRDMRLLPAQGSSAGMEEILALAGRMGMETAAWMVVGYNDLLASRYPHCRREHLFGEPDPAQLCVGNPAVRAYAADLATDIAQNHPFGELLVEGLDYAPFACGLPPLHCGVDPPRGLREILGLCFCKSCVEAAEREEVPVRELQDALQKWARRILNRLPDGLAPGETAEPEDQPFYGALEAYRHVRSTRALALLAEISEIAHSHGKKLGCVGAAGFRKNVHGLSPGDAIPYIDDYPVGRDFLSKTTFLAPKAYVQLHMGHYADLAAFRETLELARARGYRRFAFYCDALLTDRQLEWLRLCSPCWRGDTREAIAASGKE